MVPFDSLINLEIHWSKVARGAFCRRPWQLPMYIRFFPSFLSLSSFLLSFLLYIQQILHSLCLSVYIVFLFNSSFRPAPVPSFTAVLPLLAPCSDVSIRSRYTYTVGGLGVKTIAYPQFIHPPNMEKYVVKMKRTREKHAGGAKWSAHCWRRKKKEKKWNNESKRRCSQFDTQRYSWTWWMCNRFSRSRSLFVGGWARQKPSSTFLSSTENRARVSCVRVAPSMCSTASICRWWALIDIERENKGGCATS